MVASVVGGALGYAIGYFVFDQLMRLPLAHVLFGPDPLGAFQALVRPMGPRGDPDQGTDADPLQAGHHCLRRGRVRLLVFMAASIVTRGGRFFLVAALLRAFGTPVRDFIERRLTLVTSMLAAGIVGGFLVLKLL